MMKPEKTARAALRSATADHHDVVDRVFSGTNFADRDAYGRFLLAQAAAHLPIEAALTRAGASEYVPDWTARLRAGQLRADLGALGLVPPESVAEIGFDDPAAVLGGVYVLEGSRLGGAMLARGVPPEFPRSFLASGDSAAWRRLLEILETRLISAGQRKSAIESAARVFKLFEGSGRRYLKAE